MNLSSLKKSAAESMGTMRCDCRKSKDTHASTKGWETKALAFSHTVKVGTHS
ncbi:hypothetical protein B0H12DRAFT_1169492 [Mycena haematopus]|nr:hypothetical protein B0H12DRAFT_1169492 [Mycena haematopus]